MKSTFFHLRGIGGNDFWFAWDKFLFLQATPMLGQDRYEVHVLDDNVVVFSTKDHPDNQRFVDEVKF